MKNKTIELPFTIGDTIYIINNNEEIIKSTVTNVTYDLKNNFFIIDTDNLTFCSDDIGYAVFDDYNTANNKLTEMKARQKEVEEALRKECVSNE